MTTQGFVVSHARDAGFERGLGARSTNTVTSGSSAPPQARSMRT